MKDNNRIFDDYMRNRRPDVNDDRDVSRQTTVVGDLLARIAELEAEIALALAELGNDHAPTCIVGITDVQCAMGFECAKCWKEYLLMKAQEEK